MGIATAAGKATAAMRAVRNSLKVVGKIWRIIDAERSQVVVENQELSFRVPEKSGQYSVALKVKRGPFGHAKPIRFPIPGVTGISVHSLDKAFTPQPQCIHRTPDGYAFDSGMVQAGCDSLLATFSFVAEDSDLLSSLVERDWTHDSAEDESADVSEYWMSAQLRHPSVLKTSYGRLDLRGLDVRVDVGVSQDIKPRIPKPFVHQLETLNRLVLTSDRNASIRLALEKARNKYARRENDLIQQVQDLFYSHEFRKFLDVQNPYQFYECYKGAELYDIPMFTIPKEMKVVSRTDLTLEEPARNGKLLYKKRSLQDAIAKVFGH